MILDSQVLLLQLSLHFKNMPVGNTSCTVLHITPWIIFTSTWKYPDPGETIALAGANSRVPRPQAKDFSQFSY